ncbi:MAG: response regulator transcription factor [Actinomycetia bacterium]|nr:response regulator transcription factor [Actinomycetes bacterium]
MPHRGLTPRSDTRPGLFPSSPASAPRPPWTRTAIRNEPHLKDRVVDVAGFLATVRRIAGGGSAVDSEVVGQILQRSQKRSELDRLSPREREVLAALAEGLSNRGIDDKLVISQGAVEKHISNVFTKFDFEPEDHAHRRVLAVLRYLGTV